MIYIEGINECITDEIKRDNNWYYHMFSVSKSSLGDLFNNGLKAPIFTHRYGGGYNGYFYVSLSMIKNIDPRDSSYHMISKSGTTLIIDGIKPIYADPDRKVTSFKSFLPFRTSQFYDEYQAFLGVSPKHFRGITYPIRKINDGSDEYLSIIYDLLDYMLTYNIDLPFYTFADDKSLLLVDKEKMLSLIDRNI